jgi:hypothetical protein
MGDFERAYADYNMLVFSYAVELDATDQKADGYEDLVKEASRAYRARAACSQARGNKVAAGRDLKRAETLEAKVKRPDNKDAVAGGSPGSVTVRNEWAEPVTLTIAGISYTVPPGEAKTLPTPTGSFPYEMMAGSHRITGTIDAGKTYRIKPPPPPPPPTTTAPTAAGAGPTGP